MIITVEEIAIIISALAIAVIMEIGLDSLTKKMHKKGFKSWI